MKYQLAESTSEETNEIKFPFVKSHLNYFYFPKSQKFIGSNSMPYPMNYKSFGISNKAKKELNKDYPYINYTLLDSGKSLFSKKFKYVCGLGKPCDTDIKLIDSVTNLNEFNNLEKGTSKELFNKFHIEIFTNKSKTKKLEEHFSGNTKYIYILEDRILAALNNEKAFIKFKVSMFNNEKTMKKYIFEDIFYNEASFYEYLEIIKETLIKGKNSEEIKLYGTGMETMVFIHSSTTGTYQGRTKRLFNGIDCIKNIDIVLNKNIPALLDDGLVPRNCEKEIMNLKRILSIDLDQGEYSIKNGKIYKIGVDGIEFHYTGIVYDDFI